METKTSSGSGGPGRGRQQVRERLREVGIQLAQLNRRVSGRLGLRDVDMDCLDLLDRLGPLGPGALAKAGGLHPATVTGILDRLERAGWVARERDPEDRRAVLVRVLPERGKDVLAQYAGMNGAVQQICSGYDEEQLQVIADFLGRIAEAGRTAVLSLEQEQN